MHTIPDKHQLTSGVSGAYLGHSCSSPDYKHACSILGLDQKCPKLGDVVLKPWQVQGIGHMLASEREELASGIVSDGCGVGKTIQSLSLMFAATEHQSASY